MLAAGSIHGQYDRVQFKVGLILAWILASIRLNSINLSKSCFVDYIERILIGPTQFRESLPLQNANYIIVLKAISAVKDVDPVLSQLSPKESDVLMK